MKKAVFIFVFLFAGMTIHAQASPVDQMFDKYSEREGFTVVSISGKMFSMLSRLDTDNENADNIIHNLSSIKILTVKDSLLNRGINFYTELMKKLNSGLYEELMVVREGPDITKFLVKYNGDRISELLVVAGGPDGNSIISIKGSLSLKNLSDLSKSMDIKELEGLEKVEGKGK